jgi:predicted amidohydrolase YtcJ
MLSLWAGRNREPWAPGHPEQRQTLEQLLIGFTRDAAWGEFMEHEKGMLREGYLADVVLLDRDLFAVADAELASVGVMLTICDGKIVHRAL